MKYHLFSVAVSLLFTFVEVMSDCPPIYQRYSASHTYCQPKNLSCNILQSNLAQKEKNQVLHLHNHYRSVIATQQKESNGLPAASDMLFMEWDNELAAIAQRHADQCVYAHDKGNQRRVENFGVGQNIAKQTLSVQPPKPDWESAIKSFFNEIENFSSDQNCGSRELQEGQGEIGHFTQVVWAKSFRIGCGYTMYKEGNTHTRLYVCNYGPGGNLQGSCVYKEGPACSKCPLNTKCSEDLQYPGLCKRVGNEIPYPAVTEPHIFYCNFINHASPDCKVQVFGDGSWHYIPALSGKYLEVVLQPGQNGTIVFSKKLIASPDAKSMCVQVRYRKGPTLAKDSDNNAAKALLVVPAYNNWVATYNFGSFSPDFRQKFNSFSMKMGWNSPSEMKITFAVPNGASPQFFNLATIVGFNGLCKKIEY